MALTKNTINTNEWAARRMPSKVVKAGTLEKQRESMVANAIPGGSKLPIDRGYNNSPGHSPRPAMDYSNNERGSGSGSALSEEGSGTSIFDPVLCELAYTWFCPKEGRIIDPFAGGSVRGIVASKLGRKYTGIDLSERQITANREQGRLLTQENPPEWIVGDSKGIRGLTGGEFDFVFSCPPYGDLEVYSDNPEDLSTMAWADFCAAYRTIISESCSMLKANRFACFVVSEIRDKKGIYRGLIQETIQAFKAAGLELYNDAVLITAVGSLPIRAGKQFTGSRKLGRTHQNVLVFIKGDPKKATEELGEIEIYEPEEQSEFEN